MNVLDNLRANYPHDAGCPCALSYTSGSDDMGLTLIRWPEPEEKCNCSRAEVLARVEASEAFLVAYYAWAMSEEMCGGPLFDDMLEAFEPLAPEET